MPAGTFVGSADAAVLVGLAPGTTTREYRSAVQRVHLIFDRIEISTADLGGKYARKTRLEDLAICGGYPAFDDDLHVGLPNIGNRAGLLQRVNEILDSRWLTNNGRYVQEFEQRIADLVGVRHCVAMCNATSALEMTICALGLTGEVIVPSFTFVAAAHALQWQNIPPVFADIDPTSHNLDPASVEQLITPRPTA